MLSTANELLRTVAEFARRTDAGLVEGALRNASVSVAERDVRQLEDARTLRDLSRLGFADDDATESARG